MSKPNDGGPELPVVLALTHQDRVELKKQRDELIDAAESVCEWLAWHRHNSSRSVGSDWIEEVGNQMDVLAPAIARAKGGSDE